MRDHITSLARSVASLLDVRSEEEREKRAAHLVALLLVSMATSVKHVTGLTLHDSPFTLYPLAIAASAALGGLAPALVASAASLLLGGALTPHLSSSARLLFGIEAVSIALVVSGVRSRLRREEARLRAAETEIADLASKVRRARMLEGALRHLETATSEHAEAARRQGQPQTASG